MVARRWSAVCRSIDDGHLSDNKATSIDGKRAKGGHNLGTIFSKKPLNRYQLRMSCAYLRLAKQRSGAARVGAKRHSGVGSLMSAGWSRRVKALPRCAAHRSGGGRGKTNCLLVSRFVSLTPNSISDWPPYDAWGWNCGGL